MYIVSLRKLLSSQESSTLEQLQNELLREAAGYKLGIHSVALSLLDLGVRILVGSFGLTYAYRVIGSVLMDLASTGQAYESYSRTIESYLRAEGGVEPDAAQPTTPDEAEPPSDEEPPDKKRLH